MNESLALDSQNFVMNTGNSVRVSFIVAVVSTKNAMSILAVVCLSSTLRSISSLYNCLCFGMMVY